ncbi:MAG: cyclic nucleotide-binding domain-containing protein [Synechococcales cyanobacterium CRU_2_2]|nr:cyclic nucleotide-binding domain-containing protein [Synechococcales cyanobacterium CRU_2_2]
MNAHSSNLSDWLQTTVFHGLARSQALRLCEIVQPQTWQKDEQIFRQGSPATGFFVVKTGLVKIFKVSPIGKEKILNIFERRDNFAEVPETNDAAGSDAEPG